MTGDRKPGFISMLRAYLWSQLIDRRKTRWSYYCQLKFYMDTSETTWFLSVAIYSLHYLTLLTLFLKKVPIFHPTTQTSMVLLNSVHNGH